MPEGVGRLVAWLAERGLPLGPLIYVDYWASVLALESGVRPEHVRRGWVDPSLFRAGVHRPDLELPRLRYYVALLLVGPLLLPLRAFRRLGRAPILHRREMRDELPGRLAPYVLDLEPEGDRVRVAKHGTTLADGVLDPRRTAAFASLFYATYKLPFASVTGIVAMGVAVPILGQLGVLDRAIAVWLPAVMPVLAVLLYVLYRDVATAVLGTVPVVAAWLVLTGVGSRAHSDWGFTLGALGVLLFLALLADWFFVPRPVPPSLHFYADRGEGRPFEDERDAPWWLEGSAYWVWRYLTLVPAELNKFWERDWERAEIWVRADGPDAGRLEWVVVDLHYRELWIPFDRLGPADRLERQAAAARENIASGGTGFWLVEIDMNLVFHSPFVRTVSFVPDGDHVPARSLWHVLSGLFRRGPRDDPDAYLGALDRIRLARGSSVLGDLPEVILPLATRHILAAPWRYWRYPLGAHRRREPRVYEHGGVDRAAPKADPELQIKAGTEAR